MLKESIASQLKEINPGQTVVVNYILDYPKEVAFLTTLLGQTTVKRLSLLLGFAGNQQLCLGIVEILIKHILDFKREICFFHSFIVKNHFFCECESGKNFYCFKKNISISSYSITKTRIKAFNKTIALFCAKHINFLQHTLRFPASNLNFLNLSVDDFFIKKASLKDHNNPMEKNHLASGSRIHSLLTFWLSGTQVSILLEVVELADVVLAGYKFVPTIYS